MLVVNQWIATDILIIDWCFNDLFNESNLYCHEALISSIISNFPVKLRKSLQLKWRQLFLSQWLFYFRISLIFSLVCFHLCFLQHLVTSIPGESTTSSCRTYQCVGDFNEGVQWVTTAADGCTTKAPLLAQTTIRVRTRSQEDLVHLVMPTVQPRATVSTPY